jgi:tRNA G46 methylase TrmB
MDWTVYYPAFKSSEPEASTSQEDTTKSIKMRKEVEVADIGCGFGGLLVALAPKLPDTLLLGKLF